MIMAAPLPALHVARIEWLDPAKDGLDGIVHYGIVESRAHLKQPFLRGEEHGRHPKHGFVFGWDQNRNHPTISPAFSWSPQPGLVLHQFLLHGRIVPSDEPGQPLQQA